jgi:hypothetical protein
LSLARRFSSRVTVVGCHLLPAAVGIARAFNSPAMALPETKPAVRTSRIVERKASARMSETRFNATLLLVPPCSDVSWRRRVSSLLMELRCHRPPRAPVIPLRFNSFVMIGGETGCDKLSNGGQQVRGHLPPACPSTHPPCSLTHWVSCACGPEFSRVPLAHHGRNIDGCKNVWGLGLRAEKRP